MDHTFISLETFPALKHSSPKERYTSYLLPITQFIEFGLPDFSGCWASQDVWEISAEPTEDTKNSLLCHTWG